jgi:hypothetical protein
MKYIFTTVFVFILLATSLNSCRNETPVKKVIRPTFSTYVPDSLGQEVLPGRKEINYGLLTPTEITSIFARLHIPHDKTILNPTSNKDLYTRSAQASLNLGIYGVDFGYIKMFGLGQEMINYIIAVKDLANKVGIPDKFLMDPMKKLQGDESNADTIMALVNKSYTDIENHLRKDGRESVAGLMLMGGWIEAVYITTELLYNPENPDKQVVEKIAQQKYTLTSLLGFMRNYYDDPVVVYYTKKLIYLKRMFDTFDIYFKIGDLQIDTTRKVLLASGSDVTISIETLNKIRDYIAKLRTEMITP